MTGASRPRLSPIPSVASSKVRQVSAPLWQSLRPCLLALALRRSGARAWPDCQYCSLLLSAPLACPSSSPLPFLVWTRWPSAPLPAASFPCWPLSCLSGSVSPCAASSAAWRFCRQFWFPAFCFCSRGILLSNFHGPTLPDIGSAIASIVGLVLLLKVWRPKQTFRFEGEAPARLEGEPYPAAAVLRAWGPTLCLPFSCSSGGLPEFKKVLNGISGAIFTFGWPALDGEIFKTAPIVRENTVLRGQIYL